MSNTSRASGEMPEFVSWEEASRCPECKQVGNVLFSNAVIGGTLHTLRCETKDCPYESLKFFIQTDVNGNIPINKEAWKKAHSTQHAPKRDRTFDEMHEKVNAALQRQLDEETTGRQ